MGLSVAASGLVSGLVHLSRNLGLITGASAMGAVYQWGNTATTQAGGLDALAGLGQRVARPG